MRFSRASSLVGALYLVSSADSVVVAVDPVIRRVLSVLSSCIRATIAVEEATAKVALLRYCERLEVSVLGE